MVSNLTITVDAETLRRARIRALERRESVNAYLAEMLRRYAEGGSSHREVFTELAALADEHAVGTQGAARSWTRDDLHRA